MGRYTYFKSKADEEVELNLIRKYIETKHEIDKFLEKKMTPFISDRSLRIPKLHPIEWGHIL